MRSEHTKIKSYFGTGGTCQLYCLPESLGELARTIKFLSSEKLPFFLLGKGTNSLVSDETWWGAVIGFEKLNQIQFSGNSLTFGAGVENTVVSEVALTHELSGAEFMYRLPGQIGATTRMNARCYGGEMSRVVSRVTSVSPNGEVFHWTSNEAFWGYKDTVFMKNGHLVGEVELQLLPGEKIKIESAMKSCEKDRIEKGHFLFPSCGCVFKNDYRVGVSSGILLDAAGVKGLREGGAEVSHLHANFVFNKNSASSRDILELTLRMRNRVYEDFGVWMEYEMELLGHFPEDLLSRVKEKRPANWKDEKLNRLRIKTQEQQKFVWG